MFNQFYDADVRSLSLFLSDSRLFAFQDTVVSVKNRLATVFFFSGHKLAIEKWKFKTVEPIR